jgi:hypothetical protein
MSLVFRPVPGLRYIAEPGRIVLLDTQTGRALHLEYPDAAIWDMMIRGYQHRRIADSLQDIAHLTAAHADQLICDLLARLLRADLLTQERKR